VQLEADVGVAVACHILQFQDGFVIADAIRSGRIGLSQFAANHQADQLIDMGVFGDQRLDVFAVSKDHDAVRQTENFIERWEM